jgi:hypothetical protein
MLTHCLRQIYFYAMDELIDIVPNFTLHTPDQELDLMVVRRALAATSVQENERLFSCCLMQLQCLISPTHHSPLMAFHVCKVQGRFGPMRHNTMCRVPLWVALLLWKQRRCSIQPPEWMKIDYLEGQCRSHEQCCTPCPFWGVEDKRLVARH